MTTMRHNRKSATCHNTRFRLAIIFNSLAILVLSLSACHPIPKADNVIMVSQPLAGTPRPPAHKPTTTIEKPSATTVHHPSTPSIHHPTALTGQLITTSPQHPMVLTLTDAIALAMRHNLTLRSAKLERIVQKYNLIVERYNFDPQLSLQGSYTYNRSVADRFPTAARQADLSPALRWQSHYGSQVTVTQDNSYTYERASHFDPFSDGTTAHGMTTKVTQELLRGFGRDIVDASLNNAKDSERINRLQFSASATTTITGVIGNYLNLVRSQQQLEIDLRSLKRYQKMIEVDKMKIKAGRLAASDLIDLQSTLTSTKVTIERDKNSIDSAKRILLNSIGLESSVPFQLPYIDTELAQDRKILSANGQIMDRQHSFRYALQHNVDYQVAGITILSARRNLKVAKNNELPELSFTIDHSFDFGNGSKLWTDNNLSAILTYDQPINDVSRKATAVSAQVALQQAIITLKQARRDLYNTIHNDLDSIDSLKKQIDLGQQAVVLQKRNYTIARLKYNHGLISNYSLTDVTQRLLVDETSLVNDRIAYLETLASFSQDMNRSLQLWHIQIISGSGAKEDLRTSDRHTLNK
ncbi:MAG: TolC family protein [Gammaproteobacteria bacterium]|nr:TolC family protein [Gammaproteobacteria bacterium]